MDSRADRQKWITNFIVNTWGHRNMHPRERAMRLLEEAIELAQVEDVDPEEISRLIGHVYLKPVGTAQREAGGVAVCLLAYCQSAGLSADAVERAELDRLQSLDREHFRRRHQAKVDAGVAFQGIAPEDT